MMPALKHSFVLSALILSISLAHAKPNPKPPPNQAPVAMFTATDSADDGRVVSFDASTSSDTDGQIKKYEWNFGDGSRAEGQKVVHTYSKDANFTVTLKVTDDDKATSQKSQTINVTSTKTLGVVENLFGPKKYFGLLGIKTSSTEKFNAVPKVGEYYKVRVVNGDGQIHTEPKCVSRNLIQRYLCQLKNIFHAACKGGLRMDDVVVVLNGTKVVQAKDINSDVAGFEIYVPVLSKNIIQVESKGKLGAYATVVVERLAKVNMAPIANFSFATDESDGVLNASFDGSTSIDSDGQIVSYKWDFGDGVSDDGIAVTHVYAEAGAYNVELVVTDNKGGKGRLVKSVEIKDTVPPEPVLVQLPPSEVSIPTLPGRLPIYYESNEPLLSAEIEYSVTPIADPNETQNLTLRRVASAKAMSAVAASAGTTKLQMVLDSTATKASSAIPVEEYGSYAYTVTATDKSGNISQKSGGTYVPPPKPMIIVVTNPTVYYQTSSNLVLSGYIVFGVNPRTSVAIDGNGYALNLPRDFSMPLTLSEGTHEIWISTSSEDPQHTENRFKVTIDKTPPVLTIDSPVNGGTVGSLQVPITGRANERLSSLRYKNGAIIPISDDGKTFAFNFSSLGAGSQSITITATDMVGLSTDVTINFMVDPNFIPTLWDYHECSSADQL